MKHHKNTRSFGRDNGQRKALLQSLARSLVIHESIVTTEPKAKELRPFIEKIITKGRSGTVAARRDIIMTLGSETGAKKIIDTLSPKYKDRKGGYTRIIKMPRRLSDGSPMAAIAFV